MFRPRFLGVFVTSLLLALPLASCDKPGKETEKPGGGGDAAAESGNAMTYRAEARKLKQSVNYEFQISGGGQFGQAKAELVASLDVSPLDGDKLKVLWKIDDVSALELTGALKPKAEEGKPPPPDPKTVLVEKGNGAFVMNLLGKSDAEASKELPENVAKRKEREERDKAEAAKDGEKKADGDEKEDGKKEDAKQDEEKKDGEGEENRRRPAAEDQILGFFAGVFQLPELPKQALEEGKSITVEEEDEVPLGESGIKLPIESETIYTLVQIDASSGKRLAEIEIEMEASGATEMQGGMLVVDQSQEATVVFNLDDGVPVSLSVTSTQSFSVGENGQEMTTIISSEYEPG